MIKQIYLLLIKLQYIENQEQSASQAQQEAMEQETEFRDREISTDEQANLINLILGMAKVQAQGEKDNKKVATSIMQMDQGDRHKMADLMQSLVEMAQEYKLAKEQAKVKENVQRQQAQTKKP